jgi:tryptophan-rich sensory protein
MIKRFLLFLVINALALLIGGLFTNSGVESEWYTSLNKAPWTPPGWFFGVAWTTIMILLAIYMAFAYKYFDFKRNLLIVFTIQWILNVLWNPLFFYYKNVSFGLIIILLLTIWVAWWMLRDKKEMGVKIFLLLPYFVWLLVASSLNLYILIEN